MLRPALFGLLTLALNALAHSFPDRVEHLYSRGLFQGVRLVFDWTLGLLPLPSFYLFWLLVVVFWWRVYRRRPRGVRWPALAGFWLGRLAGFAGLIVGLFFWLWGFNYARVPLERQLGLTVLPLDSTELWQELERETRAVDSLRQLLAGTDTTALGAPRLAPRAAEERIRPAVEAWLAAENYPVGGRVRGRELAPAGLLFLFGAAGIYWPFVGEGNVEAGLHPLRQLPNLAHELSHGYGFGDEGVCKFIAYAALWNHPDPYVAYCARLDYWNAVARACRGSNRARFQAWVQTAAPRGVLADERAIRLHHDRFPELAPMLRYFVYDKYLKSQGIESGMRNYDEVVRLVRAWRSRGSVKSRVREK